MSHPPGEGTGPVAGRRLGEAVVAARLVVQDRDDAGGVGAEGVLGRGVDHPARAQHADVARGAVGGAPDLVERAVEGAVQSAGRAVRRHARGAAGGVDVARPGGGGLARTARPRPRNCSRRRGNEIPAAAMRRLSLFFTFIDSAPGAGPLSGLTVVSSRILLNGGAGAQARKADGDARHPERPRRIDSTAG